MIEIDTRTAAGFRGKEALVTGAGSGIAREVARQLAAAGATVTIWDRDGSAAEDACGELAKISEAGHRWAEVDIADQSSVDAAASNLRKSSPHTDVLINCAAIAAPGPITGAFMGMPESQWRPLIEVNFVGHVRVLQAILPGMIDRPEGASVVNVISDSYFGWDRNLAMYGAGKAALWSLTKTIARELGSSGVRVNGVSPSATNTPSTAEWMDKYEDRIVRMYPLGRLGTPTDQANAIVFLASEDAGWITGQILSVNGGFI